jgi:hypothetical protein
MEVAIRNAPDERVNRRWAFATFGAVGFVKIGLLLGLGPALFPDSHLYLGLGHAIAHDPGWWRQGDWSQGPIPPRLLRPYGYPLIVALAEILAPDRFQLLLAALQSLATLAVLGLVWRVGGVMGLSVRGRAATVALCALSGTSLFDLTILSDSLYGVCFAAVILGLAGDLARDRAIPPGRLVLLGAVWAASMSLRDVALYHTVLPVAGIVASGRSRRLGGRRILGDVVLFCLPVAAMVAAVMDWNLFRTGHLFFSITGAENWLWPGVNIADRHLADPFDCAGPVCRAAAATAGHGMGRVSAIVERIWQTSHPDPLRLGHMTLHYFLSLALRHPIALVAAMLGNLQFGHLADLVFNPFANLDTLAHLHDAIGHRLVPAIRELWLGVRAGHWPWVAPLVATALLQAAAIVALAAFFLLTPKRAVEGVRRGEAGAAAALFLWAAAILFVFSYALIHLEMRLAMPAVPAILLAFGWSATRRSRR